MRSSATIVALGLVTAPLLSCSSPTAPPPPKALGALHISGPGTVAPGTTAQFTLTATYSDQTTQDVTASAQWASSNPAVLTIVAGVATGQKTGEAMVTATYSSRSPTVPVLIVPAGTFRLIGQVRESGLAVPNATVQVTAGTGSGLTTTSDASGNFRLYGVAGMIQLTVTKDGYTPTTLTPTVTTNTSVEVDVSPTTPEANLSGTYTLTIAADPACPSVGARSLPDFARTRSYTATISQQGPGLTVLLSGASFVMSSLATNKFVGQEAPDDITFVLNGAYYTYYYAPHIEEALPNNQVYTLGGTIAASRSGADIVGTFSGTIMVEPTVPPPVNTSELCYSNNHSVKFVNQAGTAARTRIRR